jgi:hypothetical protein
MIYQHEARGADQAITDAIDWHVQAEQPGHDDDGSAARSLPRANGTLMARKINKCSGGCPRIQRTLAGLRQRGGAGDENRTRTISLGSTAVTAASGADLPVQVSASDRGCLLLTLANGPLMAQPSCSDPQQTGAARTALRALLLPRPPHSCPPLAVAAVSRLAKRPAPAGLALTRRTRPRSSEARRAESTSSARWSVRNGFTDGHGSRLPNLLTCADAKPARDLMTIPRISHRAPNVTAWNAVSTGRSAVSSSSRLSATCRCPARSLVGFAASNRGTPLASASSPDLLVRQGAVQSSPNNSRRDR